jgi:hypothetical protein
MCFLRSTSGYTFIHNERSITGRIPPESCKSTSDTIPHKNNKISTQRKKMLRMTSEPMEKLFCNIYNSSTNASKKS